MWNNKNEVRWKQKKIKSKLYRYVISIYEFQSESSLYSYLNVKERLTQNRRHIWSLKDSNGIRTHDHLVRERTLKGSWAFVYELSGCRFESRWWQFFIKSL